LYFLLKTFEDTPGPPSNVSFPDVSFSTARIIWDVPEEPNGEILAYKVTYLLNGSVNLNFSREFPPSDFTFRATNLLAERYYLFSITAQTRLGWGKTATVLVYTTNNREIPQPPSAPQISKSQIQDQQITFSWTPGRDGFAPLRFYTVQYRENEGPFITINERVDPGMTQIFYHIFYLIILKFNILLFIYIIFIYYSFHIVYCNEFTTIYNVPIPNSSYKRSWPIAIQQRES
jgi:protein sidekick